MSNNNSRRLPVTPPRRVQDQTKTVSGETPPESPHVSMPEHSLPAIPNLVNKKQNEFPPQNVKTVPSAPPSNQSIEHFTNVFNDKNTFFEDVPRVLTVNEQPFYRWFKRAFLSLSITTVFLLGVTFAVGAPLEIGLTSIAAVWILVLAFALPDAIIPFKKTRFDLTKNTVRVGQNKPRPISDIKTGLFTQKKRNSTLWLGFNEKDGFSAPLTSNKVTMKKADLLALRTIISKTSITPYGVVDLSGDKNKVEVTQQAIVEYIEKLILGK